MASQISRYQKWTPSKQLTLTANVVDTPAIPMAEYLGLMVGIPANSPITNLTFYVAMRQDNEADPNVPAPQGPSVNNYYQLTDPTTGNPVTQSVAGGQGGASAPGGALVFAGQAYDLTLVLSPCGALNFASLKIVVDHQGPVEISAKS